MKTEHFDGDPHWTGFQNRLTTRPVAKRQDFGWSDTAHAGSKRGEVGGVVWRSIRPAYYAKVLPRTFTLDDSLTASGRLSLTQAQATHGWQNGSTIFVGFFNHGEQGWRPRNFVGFRLEAFNEPDGATVEVSYTTDGWASACRFVNRAGGDGQERLVRDLDSNALLRIPEDGSAHTWSIAYRPDGGQQGCGELVLTMDGVTTRLPVGKHHRARGAALDRFGVFNAQMPGREMTAYFDDVSINGGSPETFDEDPGWEGAGNREAFEDALDYGVNDFGYSETSFAGGKARGEIGGRVWRTESTESQHKGYYGDDVGRLSLDRRIEARGRIAFPRFCVDSGVFVGFFNHAGQGWPPKNFVGIYFDSLTDVGRIFSAMYGTGDAAEPARRLGRPGVGSDVGKYGTFLPDGVSREFSIVYEPDADAVRGGRLTVRLGEAVSTVEVSAEHRAAGADLTRFGLFNMQDANGKDNVVYLDDLTYTTAKVP